MPARLARLLLFLAGASSACAPSASTVTTPDSGAELCGNGIDDDGDTLTDCADADCYGTADCPTVAGCGDDTREGAEVCDGSDLGGQSCGSLGYDGGDLACAADCSTYSTAGCVTTAVCGDNIIEGPEPCDGNDLGASTAVPWASKVAHSPAAMAAAASTPAAAPRAPSAVTAPSAAPRCAIEPTSRRRAARASGSMAASSRVDPIASASTSAGARQPVCRAPRRAA